MVLRWLLAVRAARRPCPRPAARRPSGPAFAAPTAAASAMPRPSRPWTEKDYNWKVKLPGMGHSSPVVWGDVLRHHRRPRHRPRRHLCLDTADGHTLWQRDYPSQKYQQHPITATPRPRRPWTATAW